MPDRQVAGPWAYDALYLFRTSKHPICRALSCDSSNILFVQFFFLLVNYGIVDLPSLAANSSASIGGYYYEEDRGAVPAYDNQWNNAGWEGWLTYHPADNGQRLTQPIAIVHSESAAIPQGVRDFLSGYAGDATIHGLEDVTQFGFYDNTEDVECAADTVAAHFAARAESES